MRVRRDILFYSSYEDFRLFEVRLEEIRLCIEFPDNNLKHPLAVTYIHPLSYVCTRMESISLYLRNIFSKESIPPLQPD